MTDMQEFVPELLGEKIGIGATADVYTYGQDKVIKIFHPQMKADYVEQEYSCDKAVENTGLPVPKNYGLCRIDIADHEFSGCYAILQERIIGTSVMQDFMSADEQRAAELLQAAVGLQVQINATDASGLGLKKQKEILHYHISIAPLITETERESLYQLLEQLPEGTKLCHCDYHFENIFNTEKGMVCFDWCDAACGNPTGDLARSLLIFKCEAFPDSIPTEVLQHIKQALNMATPLYLECYTKLGGYFDHLDEWLAVIAAARLPYEVEANKQAMLKVVRAKLSGLFAM